MIFRLAILLATFVAGALLGAWMLATTAGDYWTQTGTNRAVTRKALQSHVLGSLFVKGES
jgi:hypothetical protein